MTIQLGILLALACAVAGNIGFLCKHRGAVAAPSVNLRRPLASAANLFRSRWWTIGYLVATVAWALHVAAISIAPLSLVDAVIAGGLVLLAYPAERWFGFRLGKREWIGLCFAAVGLVLLAITAEAAASTQHARYSVGPMVAFEASLVGVGVLLFCSGRVSRVSHRHGELLAIACGLMIGVSHVAIKALSTTVPGDLANIVSPWLATAILAGVLGFYAQARALQVGEGLSVIAITIVSATSTAILGGILVFGDSVGSDPVAIVMRSGAFAAVLIAVALMPGPVRAARVGTA